jgi:hypothetical protein
MRWAVEMVRPLMYYLIIMAIYAVVVYVARCCDV